MLDVNSTTSQLLEGLFDNANDDAWRECDARYRPIIIAFARQLGLGDADAADIAQETLAKFLQEYQAGKYDRSRGRLGSWIIGIAKYRIADLRRRNARRREARGESAMLNLPGAEQLEELWNAEVKRVVLNRSMEELRTKTRMTPQTIRAFEMVTLEQKSAAAVAEELGMTVNDVYVAKNRAIEQLRKIRDRLCIVYDVA